MTSFDIAINTVGKVLKKPISETIEAEYDLMFAVNSKAGFFFIKETIDGVKDGGCIISLVTSLLGAFAPGYATYQGSKSPVEWFTKSAVKEYVRAFEEALMDGLDSSQGVSGSTVWHRGHWVNNTACATLMSDTPFFYP